MNNNQNPPELHYSRTPRAFALPFMQRAYNISLPGAVAGWIASDLHSACFSPKHFALAMATHTVLGKEEWHDP